MWTDSTPRWCGIRGRFHFERAIAVGYRKSQKHQAQDSFAWPLVECPPWRATVQSGARPHRPNRHIAGRVLLLANRHGRPEEQLWGVSLNVGQELAEVEVEVVHRQPVDIQPSIIVRKRLSKITNQLQQ